MSSFKPDTTGEFSRCVCVVEWKFYVIKGKSLTCGIIRKVQNLACNLRLRKLQAWKTLICINVTIVSALQSKTLQKMKALYRWNVFYAAKHKFDASHNHHKSWLNFAQSTNIWFCNFISTAITYSNGKKDWRNNYQSCEINKF